MKPRTRTVIGIALVVTAGVGLAAEPIRDGAGPADLIVHNAAITTLDESQPSARAVAVAAGKIVAVGSNEAVLKWQGPNTAMVDAKGRRLIPGLNDSHSHYLRGGTSFNYELRWDGLSSLKEALLLISKQVSTAIYFDGRSAISDHVS